MHWSDQFMGMDYNESSFDCATLAVEVARLHGFNVSLPSYTLKTGNDANGYQLIAEFREDYAKPVDHPLEGQPVLMIEGGKAGHIGVCTFINGEWYVLHNIEKMGVVRQPMRTIKEKIEGFYQWLN